MTGRCWCSRSGRSALLVESCHHIASFLLISCHPTEDSCSAKDLAHGNFVSSSRMRRQSSMGICRGCCLCSRETKHAILILMNCYSLIHMAYPNGAINEICHMQSLRMDQEGAKLLHFTLIQCPKQVFDDLKAGSYDPMSIDSIAKVA